MIRLPFATFLLVLTASLTGCSHFKSKPDSSYVFVTAKQGILRDRVAAVSNRVAEVANGDKLKVLDHGRHWLKVETSENKIGWIEERSVATPETAIEFDRMASAHKADPEVAGGVTRDAVFMHIKPGRETDHFYLLAEGEKLKLLKRAIVEKMIAPGMAPKAQKKIPEAAGTHAARLDAPQSKAAVAPAASLPPAMEDWWLVRDAQGHTGWLFGRMLDVDAPDTLTRYSEGQKFVGAYVLNFVHDEGAPTDQKDIPNYVAVMNSYKPGLPYDFDQVRVFTWSVQRHRYETAFRDKNVEGYLPVTITRLKDPSEKPPIGLEDLPAFSYEVLAAGAPEVKPDPATGEIKPTNLLARTFRLEGNIVHHVGTVTDAVAHPQPEEQKKGRNKH